MKIIITGSSGMLGYDICDALKNKGYDFIPLSRSELDITGEHDVCKRITKINADWIIHCAAFTKVDDCEKRRDYAFMVNSEGTKHVANACRRSGAKMIYISTDYVFDGLKKTPYKEGDRTNPISTYGISKLKGEYFVSSILKDYLIVRASWLYGRHGKNFTTAILEKAKGSSNLNIVDDQVGSPTYTVDLAEAIVSLLSLKCHGIYHVSNSGCCSWFSFAKKILALAGDTQTLVTPISSAHLDRPAERPSYSALDCSKYFHRTGKRIRTWDDALEEYMQGTYFISDSAHP